MAKKIDMAKMIDSTLWKKFYLFFNTNLFILIGG